MKSRCLSFLAILAFFCLLLAVAARGLYASERKDVVIGHAVSLTGRFGVEGKETHRGYQLWREQINGAGGLRVGDKRYPIKFVFYDDESNPSVSTKMYEKLITRDKVDLILSPWSSGINFATSAVAEKYHYPVIMSSASASKLFERGFKYIFETTQLSPTMVEPWKGFLKAHSDRIKTVAILYENFLFTVALNKSLTEFVEQAGAKVVLNEKYPIGGKDFTGLLLKVKGVNPDALIVLNIMPASVYATRQAHEVGVRPKLLMVNIGPMFEEEFIGGLGDVSEKVYESGFWHPNLPYPSAKKFAEAFEARYNKRPSTDAAYAYMSTEILTQAIEQAGSIDREKLASTLHSGKFNTIGGPYEYDARGVNKVQKGFICQVQNKHRMIVWPDDLADAKPQFMR